MRLLISLILGLSFTLAGAEVIKSSKQKINLYEMGTPPELGYWIVDSKGSPKTLVAKYNTDLKVYEKNGVFKLVKRTKKDVKEGSTPLSTISPRMTKATCGQVDIANKMGPVKDQAGGSCYAYTAIELLNFGTKERYSALHLAQMMEGKPSEEALKKANADILRVVRGFNGGQVDQALELGIKVGLCPQSIVPDKEAILKNYQNLLYYYLYIDKEKKALQEDCRKDTADIDSIADIMAIHIRLKIKQNELWYTDDVKNELKQIFPTLDPSYVKQIWIDTDNANDFMKALAEKACKGHIKKGIPLGKTTSSIRNEYTVQSLEGRHIYYEEDRPKLLDNINASLNKGRPIAISYLASGLIQPVGEKSHNYHASVVNGRKWLPEEKNSKGKVTQAAGCYYLVKNSWGEDWKVPNGLKAKSSALHPGHFVLSEKQLMEHLYGTTWID